MENLVVTLETAKKLKAAGFPQKTKLGWYRSNFESLSWHVVIDSVAPSDNWLAAPTAQEIADQLPSAGWQLMTDSYGAYVVSSAKTSVAPTVAPTMAEALALLWLKLQEATK